MKKMIVLTFEIDHENFKISPQIRNIDKENSLHEKYKYIGCDLVDCKDFDIDGKTFTVWFDDEFLLKGRAVPTMLLNEDGYKTILCNNLLFTGFTDEGEERGLKLDEVHKIIDYIYNTRQELMDEVHAMLKQ